MSSSGRPIAMATQAVFFEACYRKFGVLKERPASNCQLYAPVTTSAHDLRQMQSQTDVHHDDTLLHQTPGNQHSHPTQAGRWRRKKRKKARRRRPAQGGRTGGRAGVKYIFILPTFGMRGTLPTTWYLGSWAAQQLGPLACETFGLRKERPARSPEPGKMQWEERLGPRP